MADIGPGASTAAWLRILADQLEKDDCPDFFLVTSLGNGEVDYTWRTISNALGLLGAVQIKIHELKDEIIEDKVTRG